VAPYRQSDLIWLIELIIFDFLNILTTDEFTYFLYILPVVKAFQGSHKPGKPGIVREFCKPGKVREFEIWSGNFL